MKCDILIKILTLLVLAATLGVLIWYTRETYNLRIESQKQTDLALKQDKELNRPRIGLEEMRIKETMSFGTGYKVISIPIKNYGNLPGYFKADYQSLESEQGLVRPFQANENYIMPNQSIDLNWSVDFINFKLQNIESLNDICDVLDNRTIIITYGLSVNNLDFVTKLRTKMIDITIPWKELEERTDEFLIYAICMVPGKEDRILIWFVESME